MSNNITQENNDNILLENGSKLVSENQYFAELDENDIVLRVIVADTAFINSGAVGDPANWVETSLTGEFRGKYAAIGDFYNRNSNSFTSS